VGELTATELRRVANIPTLEEVLTDPESVPYFNVEIKSRSVRDQRVTRLTAEVIRRIGAQKKVIFSSFNPVTLRALWEDLPEVPRALLVTDDTSDPDSAVYLRKMWLGGWAHASMLNLDKKMITPELMKRLQERNVPVSVWTVNDKDTAGLLLNRGVESIISDRPV
jgi:glycerophosphoryl diester phosphodiesterase